MNTSQQAFDESVYRVAVWYLPGTALALTVIAAALALFGEIGSHWPSRFSSLWVATGIVALNHVRRPGPRVGAARTLVDAVGWTQQQKRAFQFSHGSVLLGTLLWGFGDLLF